MQVGDIVKYGAEIFILTYRKEIKFIGDVFDLLSCDGESYPTMDICDKPSASIVSYHNGSLKAGMAEFMDKYYKGE